MSQIKEKMEIPSSIWFSEWEVEESSFLPQYQMDYYSFDDNLNFESVSVSPNENYSSFSNINSDISNPQNMICAPFNIDQAPNHPGEEEDIKIRPAKQIKTENHHHNSSCVGNKQIITPKPSPSVSSQFISFGNSNHSSPAISQPYIDADLDYSMSSLNQNKGTKRPIGSLTRSPLHAQDHVIAERKRREKISQLYIALSALIPNLKKADKASILAGATKYVKQIQERVKVLEEQAVKKTVESAVFVKKTKVYSDEDSSSDESFNCQGNHSSLPEIEAKVSERDVLITIHCENNKGILANIMHEVEKLNLSAVSSNVMPFGRKTLHITIAAEMEDVDFSISAKDVVKNLRLALQRSN